MMRNGSRMRALNTHVTEVNTCHATRFIEKSERAPKKANEKRSAQRN